MAEKDDVLEQLVVREVAAVFRPADVLQDAIQALLHAGSTGATSTALLEIEA